MKSEDSVIRRHLLLGWGGLFLFIVLGAVLEWFHAMKAPVYLDADNETRRLLWRLAHAHGAVLSLLQIGAAWTFAWLGQHERSIPHGLVSWGFVGGQVLLPLGFFLAGWTSVAGDPGVAIVLVPAGAVLLLGAVGILVAAIWRAR